MLLKQAGATVDVQAELARSEVEQWGTKQLDKGGVLSDLPQAIAADPAWLRGVMPTVAWWHGFHSCRTNGTDGVSAACAGAQDQGCAK